MQTPPRRTAPAADARGGGGEVPPFTPEMIEAGAVLLGYGREFEVPEEGEFDGWAFDTTEDGDQWEAGRYLGYVRDFLFAAPADSEVVKLNTPEEGGGEGGM